MEPIAYSPVGIFRCPQQRPSESPRQGVLASHSIGVVELDSRLPLECLSDLVGFDHLWLVYSFHKNNGWKPMVRPPRGSEKKRGVFATRSPYRPNGIGMSCVVLDRIDGRQIVCREHDLLDGTPILDIKPYLSYSDSFPSAKQGWVENIKSFKVSFSELARLKMEWLETALAVPFIEIVINQLSVEPTNKKIKRVAKKADCYCLSYRTWRMYFTLDDNQVSVCDVGTGYSVSDLENVSDPYCDKELHRAFLEKF